MNAKILAGAAALLTALPLAAQQARPMITQATPIITVEEIEPCLPFWTERLGFEVTGTVPHEDRLGFAMLQGGSVELMYQSRASVEADLGPAGAAQGFPGLPGELEGSTTTLFMQVEALDPIVEVLEGIAVVVPRRQTFYGMDEIFVRPPCGSVVGFAAKVEDAPE